MTAPESATEKDAPMPTMTDRRTSRRMSRLLNLVTAAAVAAAVTASPAPAEAGGKDVARSAALIALLAIGAGLYQQQANARTPAAPVARALPPEPEPRHFRPAPQLVDRSPRPVANPGWRDPRWHEPPVIGDRQGPRIPAVCAVEIDGRQPATIYADSCLAREGFTFALPQHCAQTIRSRDWSGRIYDGACLRDAGFRTDRRW
jgi:hypothetical protein